jgi:DNA-binding PadR family transcriptional regulator
MDRKGSSQLELMLLALLRRPAHGYQLIEELRARSDGALEVPEGTVYPALYRLERAELLASSEALVAGRRRRVYRLTRRGLAALEKRRAAWEQESAIVTRILEGGVDLAHA